MLVLKKKKTGLKIWCFLSLLPLFIYLFPTFPWLFFKLSSHYLWNICDVADLGTSKSVVFITSSLSTYVSVIHRPWYIHTLYHSALIIFFPIFAQFLITTCIFFYFLRVPSLFWSLSFYLWLISFPHHHHHRSLHHPSLNPGWTRLPSFPSLCFAEHLWHPPESLGQSRIHAEHVTSSPDSRKLWGVCLLTT